MSHSFSRLLYHIVFSTRGRRPWIKPEIEERIWEYLGGIVRANDRKPIKIGGVAVVATQSYRITVNAFLADGGDGFAVLKEGTNRVAGGLDLDALLKLFSDRGAFAPPPSNRITRR